MKRNISDEKQFTCFLCDNLPIIIAVTLVGIVALVLGSYRGLLSLPPLPEETPIPFATPIQQLTPLITPWPTLFNRTPTPESLSTEQVLQSTNVPSPTAVAAVPEMVFAVLPVNWGGTSVEFRAEAERQMELFLQESLIDKYFRTRVIYLESGLENVSLTDVDLIYQIVEFGAMKVPADRYIGITDQDLAPNGNVGIAGWAAFFGQGVVAESYENVSAHELGHTYGLCDEYSYREWRRENDFLLLGCPNPYPEQCEKVDDSEAWCEGTPTDDGRNSIMGAGGPLPGFGFNRTCLDHLNKGWQNMQERTTVR